MLSSTASEQKLNAELLLLEHWLMGFIKPLFVSAVALFDKAIVKAIVIEQVSMNLVLVIMRHSARSFNPAPVLPCHI